MRRIIWTAALGLAGLAAVLGQAPSADEAKAVRAAADSYTAAFNKGDLDGLMAHFAPDADFISESGKPYRGKASLRELFKQSLSELKGFKLETSIQSVHFVRPDVAIADGEARLTAPDGGADSGRFTAVWTKTAGNWLLCSVRDLPQTAAAPESTAAPLQQLEWLIGEWTHQDPNFPVQVSGRWALDKSFLQLEYSVKGKDSENLTVLQYFGWDPVDGVIRSWFFDSRGGYGGGDWTRTGNTWASNWSGVLADGRTASSVSSLQYIDAKSFRFRSVDREIDGQPIDDVDAKFLRKTEKK